MVKKLLRNLISYSIGVILASYFLTGFIVKNNLQALLTIAIILVVVNAIVRPLIKIVSFPVNLVTMGFFEILLTTLFLYIVLSTLELVEITSSKLNLEFLGVYSLAIPNFELNWLFTLFVASFIINIARWIVHKLIF